MHFSIIIPVFNRPDEIGELLSSLVASDFTEGYEIVIVEDGSTIDCKSVVNEFADRLNIKYFFKKNSGPGDSRNFGMLNASGDYFLIFDSDVIIPAEYLNIVSNRLQKKYIECFGGTDRDLTSFSSVQKAINYAMTSVLTTGGVRGASENMGKFQPRSFNMGISKKAFAVSGGFGNIHPGEDPDLTLRLWNLGIDTALFSDAYVYHKRRISWKSFATQVNKFGKVRPILDSWHPKYQKLSYYFPSLFSIGLILSVAAIFFKFYWPIVIYIIYFSILIFHASVKIGSLKIGMMSGYAAILQFYNYGRGFAESFIKIKIFGQDPKSAFPKLFFIKP